MTDPRGSAHEVLRAIRQLARWTKTHSLSLSKESGLTLPQLICLKTIGDLETDDLTLAKLAAAVGLSSATVSRVIERMTKAGIVARERQDKDRRKIRLRLTQSGRSRYRDLPELTGVAFFQRWSALESEERTELLAALARLLDLTRPPDE